MVVLRQSLKHIDPKMFEHPGGSDCTWRANLEDLQYRQSVFRTKGNCADGAIRNEVLTLWKPSVWGLKVDSQRQRA